MNKKRLLVPVLLCTIVGIVGCSKDSKMEIKPQKMETSIESQPYKDLKAEWKNMNLERYIVRAAQQIWNTWPYSNKVWPGTDYSKFNVLFVDTEGKNAWLVSQDKKISKINAKDLPSDYKAEGVPFIFKSSKNKLNNVPTIKVELDANKFKNDYDTGEFESLPDSTMLFPFVTHEEFHRYQDTWKVGATDQEKLEEIGQKNFKARAQRYEIINALKKAVLEPEKEKEYLESAKWWFEEYKKDNKEEYELVKTADVLEGSGRYFDMAMNVRSVAGMNVSKKDALKMYQDMTSKDYKLDANRFFGLPDEESYDIGGPTGILLEMKGNTSWKSEVEKGTPPLEILLKNYKATPQKSSSEVEKLIKDIKDNRSKQTTN